MTNHAIKIINNGIIKAEYDAGLDLERAILFDGKKFIVKIANFRIWEYKTLSGAEKRYNSWGLINF
jgi:hypothetical protein